MATLARSRRWPVFGVLVAFLTVLALLALPSRAPGLAAQNGGEAPHPAHIHDGSCDQLGDVIEPLTDVASVDEGEVEGAAAAIAVQVSETEVELPLADILAAPHAINIHRSAEEIQDYIACGDIGGRVVDGRLVIGLQEINGSDYTGVATLTEDDDETEVAVYLFEEGAVAGEESAPTSADDDATAAADDETATADAAEEATTAEAGDETATAEADEADEADEVEGTAGADAAVEADEEATVEADDEATAEPAAAAGEEVAVDIKDFSFNPDRVEIAVGDTVTWTNQDAVPHTSTARDRDAFGSDAIASGDEFSHTFEEAGEFDYFCEFHANMTGTIVVE